MDFSPLTCYNKRVNKRNRKDLKMIKGEVTLPFKYEMTIKHSDIHNYDSTFMYIVTNIIQLLNKDMYKSVFGDIKNYYSVIGKYSIPQKAFNKFQLDDYSYLIHSLDYNNLYLEYKANLLDSYELYNLKLGSDLENRIDLTTLIDDAKLISVLRNPFDGIEKFVSKCSNKEKYINSYTIHLDTLHSNYIEGYLREDNYLSELEVLLNIQPSYKS
jgi:hypothetical protein